MRKDPHSLEDPDPQDDAMILTKAHARFFLLLLLLEKEIGAFSPQAAPHRTQRNLLRPRTAESTTFAESPTTSSAASASAYSEAELIEKAKEFLDSGTGFYSSLRPELLDDDFIFRGGVVGPLNKEDYLRTMTLLGVSEAFDLSSNYFGFTLDPDVPNSVRFFIRNRGEHVKSWQPWGAFPPLPLSPTAGMTSVVAPTETARLIFSDSGKVKHFGTGLVVGKYEQEVNTNGLGAVLGLFNAIGVGQVGGLALSKQVRDFSNAAADQFEFLKIPKTKSLPEKVPAWWKE